jgi:hypothetical protein
MLWRTTGEGITFTPNTSESGELGGSGRFKKPSNVTGMAISGDINFELAKFPALEAAIASVLASDWGDCPLGGSSTFDADRITVGEDMQTFTIEKRFPNPANVAGTIHTVTTGATDAQTVDIIVDAATATGTGLVVVELTNSSTGISRHVSVPINVGDDESAVGTALATAVNALADFSATAAANVVTVDAGAGNTVTAVTARAGVDRYFYQRYKGVTFSTFSLAIAPNSPITGSAGIVGGSPELDYLPLAGATYVSAGNNPVFTAPQVMTLDVGQAMGIGTHCWTSLNINLDSGNRGIPCIGTIGDRETVLGTLSATVSGEVYFSDQSILEALLENKTIGDSTITLADADGNFYRWDFYGMKPTAGQVAAGGAGQDLTVPITLEPTPVAVCEDAVAGTEWESGLILSTVNTAPLLP